MDNIYDILDPHHYEDSVTHISNLKSLYQVVGMVPYGYSISKCLTQDLFSPVNQELYMAHTACYGYIVTHLFSRHMIQTTYYTKNFLHATSIVNQIPAFPEFVWELLHHKIPEWNETAYHISDTLIGFYCETEGQSQVCGHLVTIGDDEIMVDNTSYDFWGRGLFRKMMWLRQQWSGIK